MNHDTSEKHQPQSTNELVHQASEVGDAISIVSSSTLMSAMALHFFSHLCGLFHRG
jgi:hypothetical protein